MARPPLAIGTAGKVTTTHHPDRRGKQWQAYASFRDLDGATRQVERWGVSQARAKRLLAEALRDRVPRAPTALTHRSRFREAAGRWVATMQTRRAIRTVESYRWILSRHVLPALGDLRLGECTTPRLDDYLDELAARGFAAETRRNVKTVIMQVLRVAVRHGALTSNPAKELSRIEGEVSRVRALTVAECADLLAKVDVLRCAPHLESEPVWSPDCKRCRALRRNVPDLIRFMLGTGVRIGEALALRWCDVDLVGVDAFIGGKVQRVFPAQVGSTLVRAPGKGLVRQGEGKTSAATRAPLLPEFVVEILRARRPADAPDDFPIFPSAAHTWWDPANAQDALRRAVRQAGYPWVTSHVFRKTAATTLDDAGLSARQIADQLGHARPSLTQDVYMHRGAANPAAAAALDAAYRG